MGRLSEQNVQQKWACPMSENPALFREHMDIRFANVLFVMWKLQAKMRLHPLWRHLVEHMCNFWNGRTVSYSICTIYISKLSA